MGSLAEHFVANILPLRPNAPAAPVTPSSTTGKRARADSTGSQLAQRNKRVKDKHPVPPLPITPLNVVLPSFGPPLSTTLWDSLALPTPQSQPRNRRSSTIAPATSSTGSPPEKPTAKTRIYFATRDATDLILRSNDPVPVSCYVDSQIVFDASRVIHNLSSLMGRPVKLKDRVVEVINMELNSNDLLDLLRLAYPKARKPVPSNPDHLDRLIGLAKNFQLDRALHTLCVSLHELARTEPLRAYGIACNHSLTDDMRLISRETLRIDLRKADITHDLANCQPHQIQKLVRMHAKRAAAALNIIAEASTEEFTCPGEYCEEGVAEWWLEVIKRSRTELKARPTTDILFSPAFLAECCRYASRRCATCPTHFLTARAQHKLGCIKDEIDALPCSL